MQVETYEEEEVQNECLEEAEKAKELIAELGLSGQKELLSDKGRVPYRLMTPKERFVYSILLPNKTDVASFGQSAIPLRVLQVLAHAKSLGFFDCYQIWHGTPQSKDPFLVGIKGSSWSGEIYPLARWGDVLDEMPALLKQAITTWRAKVKGALSLVISKAQSSMALADKVTALEEITQDGNYKTPEFYGWGS